MQREGEGLCRPVTQAECRRCRARRRRWKSAARRARPPAAIRIGLQVKECRTRHSREVVLSALHVPNLIASGEVRHKVAAGLCCRSHKSRRPHWQGLSAWQPRPRQRGDRPNCGQESSAQWTLGQGPSPRGDAPTPKSSVRIVRARSNGPAESPSGRRRARRQGRCAAIGSREGLA